MSQLRISEVFYSLQGEGNTTGIPTTFVRLTGCPLRCAYCDTTYAFKGGQMQSFTELLQQLDTFPTRYVTVTGGEPLAQKQCLAFLSLLCENGYRVSLETSGALDVSEVDARVVRVLDIKTPGSEEVERNYWANIDCLLPHDQVKFVICDRNDYEWAVKVLNDYQLIDRCDILFSPSYQQQSPTELADWILQDGLQVRFQIQLHKFLWGDKPGV